MDSPSSEGCGTLVTPVVSMLTSTRSTSRATREYSSLSWCRMGTSSSLSSDCCAIVNTSDRKETFFSVTRLFHLQ